ncbi:tetratricopeptide repeat protein [Comamonas piscis]|uniref:Tetratricopeptide repeat protein n=1 Tax=Comamonas piscis TaxID=1562974 RepID=A0A7G5EG10_9BURK|nr:tetratricopeptide repeat protein [Comamonas piscis]QMV72935.1 tetratricopeptide repeat protein [Comamonas piscis]WSO35716.1 tetratricopeptide repeat protein [Comamonas piscis]
METMALAAHLGAGNVCEGAAVGMCMDFRFSIPTPLEHFESLVSSDDGFPLLEAAAAVACIEYPQLDTQQVLNEVDQLLGQLMESRDANSRSALTRLKALNHRFYVDWGFQGNSNDFYALDNSCLNAVLHRRRGIPVSLAVIWLELASALQLPAHGICFPGHFLLKVSVAEGQIVLDPLSGQSFSSNMLAEMLEPMQKAFHRVDEDDVPLGLYLQAASPRDIIVRMLSNLKEVYRSDKSWAKLIEVQNRLLVLQPSEWTELRDRGLAYAELGVHDRAREDLQQYLNQTGSPADAAHIRAALLDLQRM